MRSFTSFPLGRRSRWLVIGTWLVLAVALGGLQPKLQVKAQDESETFRARGAESTTVHHLLDGRFKEGPWSTAVIAFQATRGSIYEQNTLIADTMDKICSSPTLPNRYDCSSHRHGSNATPVTHDWWPWHRATIERW